MNRVAHDHLSRWVRDNTSCPGWASTDPIGNDIHFHMWNKGDVLEFPIPSGSTPEEMRAMLTLMNALVTPWRQHA